MQNATCYMLHTCYSVFFCYANDDEERGERGLIGSIRLGIEQIVLSSWDKICLHSLFLVTHFFFFVNLLFPPTSSNALAR